MAKIHNYIKNNKIIFAILSHIGNIVQKYFKFYNFLYKYIIN